MTEILHMLTYSIEIKIEYMITNNIISVEIIINAEIVVHADLVIAGGTDSIEVDATADLIQISVALMKISAALLIEISAAIIENKCCLN